MPEGSKELHQAQDYYEELKNDHGQNFQTFGVEPRIEYEYE